MKIKINTDIIKSLSPCKDRLDNWLLHYKAFEGDLVEFLDLPNISYSDKIWVSVRVMPRFLVEVFAIDCAFNAADASYASSAAYAYAADAANYAAAAAVYVNSANSANSAAYAVYDELCQRQIEVIIYLIQGAK